MQTHHRRRSSKTILIPRISSSSFKDATSPIYSNPNYARRMTAHLPDSSPDTTYLYGYALLCATFIWFTFSIYSIVSSKFMPDVNIKVLDWIKYDEYYCFLVPITAIVWIYWVLWNWMGMKFFKHN